MVSQNYLKVKEVFSAALEIGPGRRKAFLDRTCGDHETRQEVDSLLQARKEAGSFLEDISAVGVVQNSFHNTPSENFIGNLIDKFRIVKEVGRGGMGIVFLAEREAFHQQVALKVIKRGMDSDAILARFFREREILAGLNHPFIAKLLDGGTTDDGLPYFVLEYVDGVPINEFCKHLKEREILELFRKVCSAVAFAHRKLIVHRDLKPSNILINKDGEPKLLDFGIAKLLDQTEKDATQPHHRVFTPGYASPEQAAGLIVGTASDVYSLGKNLAELLGHSTGKAGARVSNTNGAAKPAPSERKLSTDLQNIIAMAVRDDPDLRYGSIERFSDDIQRYLDDLPVSAHRVSFSYRTQKFLQRNIAMAALAALLGLSLIGGLTATILNASEARYERVLAERRFENLRKLSDSLVTEIHGAIQNLPGSLPARQLLLKRATGQLDTLAEESGNSRSLQDELATAYFNLASLPDIEVGEKDRILKKVVAIYESLLRDEPNNLRYREQMAFADIELGDTAKVRGSVADGLDLGKTAVAIFEQVAADEPGDASHLRNLREAYANVAALYNLEGNIGESLLAGRRALEIGEKLRDRNDPTGNVSILIDRSHLQIGTALISAGDYKTAVAELQTALDGITQGQTENLNDTRLRYYLWSANRHLAAAAELDGDRKKAFEYADKAVAIIASLMSTSPKDIGYHRNSAITQILLGQMYVRSNQPATALTHFRRAHVLSEEVLANDPGYFESKIDLARSNSNLGSALIITGEKLEGMAQLRESLEIFEETSRIDTENALLKRDYAEACGWLAAALEHTDKAAANELYRRSYVLWSELKSKNSLSVADASRPDEAESALAEASRAIRHDQTF
jgi:serine/threonine protein kinase